MGLAWPIPRFTDKDDGTVKDNLTGLIWLKDAYCFGDKPWATALSDCNGLADGSCGLTDVSVAGDWRLPNIKELQSLCDYGQIDPAFPSEHPFNNVGSYGYWSSTTRPDLTEYAYVFNIYNGGIPIDNKTKTFRVWPVRGGN